MKLSLNIILPMALAATSVNAFAIERNHEGYDFLVGARASYIDNKLGDSSDTTDAYGAEFTLSKSFQYRPKLSAGFQFLIDVAKVNHRGYSEDFDVNTWGLSPFVSYRIMDQFEIYAKVGIANWSYELNDDYELNGYDPIYGAGLRFNFVNRAYVGLEWQFIEMDDKDVELDTQFATLSAGYRF
ncbi:outer membrane protein [Vibrio parahaemolyticus]|uniref:outer membrane protein n=1 Tax=Vibrio parahaemolyticus TaxID=670 RepID=UPI000813D194|nr:outer membrane beta-barrel protein [Vibrio parahaemolyticus]OCP68326.1 hypothetical protein AKH08_16050 [Vibrio parahaemolyticus]